MEYIKQLISFLRYHMYVVLPLSRVWGYMAIEFVVWTLLAIAAWRAEYEKLWRGAILGSPQPIWRYFCI